MVTAKKTVKKSSGKTTVGATAITYVVKRGAAGPDFTCPPGSTIAVLQSGALILQHPTTGNPFTHVFAPGQWLSVNV